MWAWRKVFYPNLKKNSDSTVIHKTFLLLCLLLGGWGFGPETATATPQQEGPQLRFDRANDLMADGNFNEALSIYRELQSRETVSGPLFLNMGVSYIRLDSLGKAKYYFMKAAGFPETKQRAEAGLAYVESNFSRQSAVLPKLPWQQFLDWLNEVFGAPFLLALGIVFLNAGVMAFAGHWFLTAYTNILKFGGIAAAAAGLIIISTGFYLDHLAERYSPAVMIHERANVMDSPSTDAAIVSQAYEGYSFTVDHRKGDEQPGWEYVRMRNGLYGWIATDDILIL